MGEDEAKKNIASFPAQRVTKMNLMRAAAKIFSFETSVKKNIVENSLFYFSGSQ